MSKSRWLVVALICSLAAMPSVSNAQEPDSTKGHVKAEAKDFMKDVLMALLGPNWNLFANGGFTPGDRFLLQRVANTVDAQRALKTSTGFNVGGGAGVDILLRMGFRASYTFTSSGLNFRTDDGNGSEALDIDDVGTLRSHTGAFEVMRYMLPTRAAINPYGTLGVQGTWWALEEKSPLITSNGSIHPFSASPLFSFGIQFKAADKWSGRLETTMSGGRNPFTGKKSFSAFSGPTIDERTGVNRTDFRVAGVYHFGKPKMPTEKATPPAVAGK